MSTTANARAKRWKTNPFIAQWLVNTVDACSKPDSEYKEKFETWLENTVGPYQAKLLISKDFKIPAKKKAGSYTGNAYLWNAAAAELGVSENALQLMHQFAAVDALFEPPRTKPGPKRLRGESSANWLARRHKALLEGCIAPNMSFVIARNIAISEYDKARDTLEAWRRDPELFFSRIIRRGPTSLVHPRNMIKGNEDLSRLDMAFRAQIHFMTLSHFTWKHAAELFEDLALRNLVTPGAIEREFKNDERLLWRLIACLSRVHYLLGHLQERLCESLSHCKAFRPYFVRHRNTGQTDVSIDEAYFKSHPPKSLFDQTIVKHAQYHEMLGMSGRAFFENFEDALRKDPSQAKKISAEAFEDMGDLAVVKEFQAQINESPFARKLMEFAIANDTTNSPVMLSESRIMNPKTMTLEPRNENDKFYSRLFARSTGGTWMECTNWLSIIENLNSIDYDASTREIPHMTTEQYDEMWRKIDFTLSKRCARLDPPGEKGSVAAWFGVWDLLDAQPARPWYWFGQDVPTEEYDKAWSEKKQALSATSNAHAEPRKTPAPSKKPIAADVTILPVAAPTDSIVSSGATYSKSGEGESQPKKKKKTKVSKTDTSAGAEKAVKEEDEDEPLALPEALPEHFKMGRKHSKILESILSPPDHDSSSGDAAKRGQIRWGEFERVMDRIGFEVVQTSGSSVRFDPPAATARPITFHRPHPDSTMSPLLLKVVGARLKRTYGWTTETFAQAEGE